MKRKRKSENVQLKSGKYTDLPIRLRKEICRIIEWRKKVGLFDDSVERKERALRYQEFRNGKTIH